MSEVTQRQIVEDRLEYLVERIRRTMEDKGVSRERDLLYNSFVQTVISASPNDVKSAGLKFNYYLRYLDMGVGRGVPVGSKAEKIDFLKYRNRNGRLQKYNRRKIPVYNTPVTAFTKRLVELLAENFNIQAIQAVENVIEKNGGVEIKI
jgi:hypothetical protein